MQHRCEMFPFWQQLTEDEKQMVEASVYTEKYNKGMLMHRTEDSCKGLMTVLTGCFAHTYFPKKEGK